MKKSFLAFFFLIIGCSAWAVDIDATISISNPESWQNSALIPYVGKVVRFETPMIVTGRGNNSGSELTISPRRIFSATNQELPGSIAYNNLCGHNANAGVHLSNAPTEATSRRTGVRIEGLVVKVSSKTNLTWISGKFVGNSRADLEKGIDMEVINARGEHNLLVCGMNCEYYLTSHFGTGSSSSMGPANEAQHQKQRAKVSKALALINADLYGLVEVQQGSGSGSALYEIAADLTQNLKSKGRDYREIMDYTSASGTYTKSGIIYDATILEPLTNPIWVSAVVKDRKMMLAFRHKPTGETFIYSINHFKAKSGSGVGLDANQGDGQGQFNHSRVVEARAVLDEYNSYTRQLAVSKNIHEKDILIMGDLNAYGMEDPITTMTQRGMYNLHREFHADSSYSYTFGDQAGYLDHALCNSTMFGQVTGMMGFHINSDESDDYTYDKSNDNTMFRCSDHDPVIVGLRLDSTLSKEQEFGITGSWSTPGDTIHILNANLNNRDETIRTAYYRLYTTDGRLMYSTEKQGTPAILSHDYELTLPVHSGVYILVVYAADGYVRKQRIIVQ